MFEANLDHTRVPGYLGLWSILYFIFYFKIEKVNNNNNKNPSEPLSYSSFSTNLDVNRAPPEEICKVEDSLSHAIGKASTFPPLFCISRPQSFPLTHRLA